MAARAEADFPANAVEHPFYSRPVSLQRGDRDEPDLKARPCALLPGRQIEKQFAGIILYSDMACVEQRAPLDQ